MTRYYFDSGVFITPILKNRYGPVIDKCIEWQVRMKENAIEALTSFLTWDEVVYVVQRTAGKETAARIGKIFLNLSNLEFIPPGEEIMRMAQDLLEVSGSRPRDAIHASTSILCADGNMVTLDIEKSDFRKIKSKDGKVLLNLIEVI